MCFTRSILGMKSWVSHCHADNRHPLPAAHGLERWGVPDLPKQCFVSGLPQCSRVTLKELWVCISWRRNWSHLKASHSLTSIFLPLRVPLTFEVWIRPESNHWITESITQILWQHQFSYQQPAFIEAPSVQGLLPGCVYGDLSSLRAVPLQLVIDSILPDQDHGAKRDQASGKAKMWTLLGTQHMTFPPCHSRNVNKPWKTWTTSIAKLGSSHHCTLLPEW